MIYKLFPATVIISALGAVIASHVLHKPPATVQNTILVFLIPVFIFAIWSTRPEGEGPKEK